MNKKAAEFLRTLMKLSMYEAQEVCRDIRDAVDSIAQLKLPVLGSCIRVYSHMGQKITCIKWVREMTGLGLRESKELVDKLDGFSSIMVRLPHPYMAAEGLERLKELIPNVQADIVEE